MNNMQLNVQEAENFYTAYPLKKRLMYVFGMIIRISRRGPDRHLTFSVAEPAAEDTPSMSARRHDAPAQVFRVLQCKCPAFISPSHGIALGVLTGRLDFRA